VTTAVILGRFLLIHVFLSEKFQPAAPLFPWQAAGDLLHAAGRAVGVGVLAFASARTWLLLGLLGSGSFFVAFTVLVGRTGIAAGSQAWLASGVLYLAATYVVVRRGLEFRLYPRCRVLVWATAVLLVGTVLVADGSLRSYAIGFALLLFWLTAAVRIADLREAVSFARRRIGRR
jgi:O-antigen/teichoic acid export membrane protein